MGRLFLPCLIVCLASAFLHQAEAGIRPVSLTEYRELSKKAKAGDADAAYRLSIYGRYPKENDQWLELAAKLGHAAAQRWLAYEIKQNYHDGYAEFGETRQEAVLTLLTKSAVNDYDAANNLADAYREGYFGENDKDVKALAAYRHAASLYSKSSWQPLAEMLYRGEGTEPNTAQAYYYICLATHCIHYRSVTGKKLWQLRLQIEKELSLAEMKEVWENVDQFLDGKLVREGSPIQTAPLGGTTIRESDFKKYLAEVRSKEKKHRHFLSKIQ